MSKRKAYRTDLSDTAGSAKKGTPIRLPGPEEDGPPALVDKDLYRRIVHAGADEAPLPELFGLETPTPTVPKPRSAGYLTPIQAAGPRGGMPALRTSAGRPHPAASTPRCHRRS
nr:hypothetical protein OH837_47345 [Streptomyces canus]